ncbi:MAG: TIGR01777 family oxidoreductase [Chthoniobacterales bacterium]
MSERRKTIVIAGGSGFIGQALCEKFLSQNHDITVLTRARSYSKNAIRFVQWDGKTLGDWTQSLEGADAVINLTGKTINCRHTPENKRAIMQSRVDAVHSLGAAIRACAQPPHVFVQTSAVGIYGDQADHICDENSPHGSDFVAQVCEKWEAAFHKIDAPDLRKVVLRLGVVLSPQAGMLRVLGRLTRSFLGGHAGSGRQFISWIDLADVVEIFSRVIAREDFRGTYNATAPNPVTNAEFMRELRHSLHRPWSPPVPEFAVKIGSFLMGTEGSLALTSQRVVPKQLLDCGYEFLSPRLRPALAKMFAGEISPADPPSPNV